MRGSCSGPALLHSQVLFDDFILDPEMEFLQISADTKPDDVCSDVHAAVPDQHCLRHSDKIPPVKPCFKKKQSPKVLGSDTLHALRPIFSSFLESGTLNGIFVNKVVNAGSLCEPLVKKALEMEQQCSQTDSLISANPSLTPIIDHPPSVPSTQKDLRGEPPDVTETEPTFPSESSSAIAATTANEDFQDPLLQANPSDSSNPDSMDKASETCTAGFFQDISCLDQYDFNQDNVSTGIFQDKTEEASLLLVFELLNQLQYHVHQKDGVDICVDFLQGLCFYGNDCPKHHTVLPYHWQVRKRDGSFWQSLNDDSQEHMERLYCSPDRDQIKMRYQGHEFIVELNCMHIYESLVFDQIRRLSTPSTSAAASNYHTVWKYFCHDHFGWREYSEPVVKLIEEASIRGLKEVRFVTFHNQYILNIKDGFQQNACFRKEIKRRPLFRSSVLLLPHLQTLSGLAPVNSLNDSPSSQLLSPVAITFPNFYPETWISMESTQEFVQVPVSREDKSYRTVYTLFHKTLSETKFRILKIQRVQNLFLWEKYKRKKEFMARKMTGLDRIMNERHLFHGTTQDVVDGICKHNFDPRVCGKHATMFGQGSYFARKASYSHGFSKQSPKGVRYMFLAKVLTGRYVVGNHTMRRPPPLHPGNITSDLFDSCVDKFFEPQIFVIFNDDQSYPYFIIQYEEVSDTVSI